MVLCRRSIGPFRVEVRHTDVGTTVVAVALTDDAPRTLRSGGLSLRCAGEEVGAEWGYCHPRRTNAVVRRELNLPLELHVDGYDPVYVE